MFIFYFGSVDDEDPYDFAGFEEGEFSDDGDDGDTLPVNGGLCPYCFSLIDCTVQPLITDSRLFEYLVL